MKPLFILTSALNTKFGVHSNEQRLAQTLDSIASIRRYCPGASVAVVEMGGIPATDEQIATIESQVEYYYNFSLNEAVQGIFHSTDNWDIVKNTTEVMIFGELLTQLIEARIPEQFDRIFKMSGRYQLTEQFNPADYDTVPDRIVVLERKASQFPPQVTDGMEYQYMSRLWSWPAKHTDQIIDSYLRGFVAMAQRLDVGGYFDIEHMLYYYLPEELVTERPVVGLRGLLGPNGVAIED
jgi:hypothetical protein